MLPARFAGMEMVFWSHSVELGEFYCTIADVWSDDKKAALFPMANGKLL